MIEIRVGRLAQRLGVHRNTVTNWIRSGKLKAAATVAKKYLITQADLLEFCLAQNIPQERVEALFSNSGADAIPAAPAAATHHRKAEVTMTSKPIGSVMVVGGGIAGIQAALDLANSGFFVHMVEKSAGIGGVMSQLDKTFPTNDCAM
jgi:excisionase family DNA binding protein